MSDPVGVALLILGILTGGLYYLVFGGRSEPKIFRDLNEQRLRELVSEAFSYGKPGSKFILCLPTGTRALVMHKDIRAKNDVHLVFRTPEEDLDIANAVLRDLATTNEHAVRAVTVTRKGHAMLIDFVENVPLAVRFATRFVFWKFNTRIEDGCYYYTEGFTIFPALGWERK